MTRLVSWNVNGIRAVSKKGFAEWLLGADIDVLSIQETKAQFDQLSEEITEIPGYKSYWASAEKKGYSGVAVYSRIPVVSHEVLGTPQFDAEGRVLSMDLGDFVLLNCYFPNSQEAGKRLGYKLAFCKALHEKCDELVAAGRDIVICGDFNVAHKEIDLKNPKANKKNPGFLPEERAWIQTFLDSGYKDSFRMFSSEGDQYTWWSYRFKARERNSGWRIDYHCVNDRFAHRVKDARIWQDVFGSDHCPVVLELY